MAIDFNSAEEQKEARGPIPPRSAVKVRLAVRQPRQPGSVEGLHYANSGAQCLDTEMEVVAGTFQGNKIWQMFVVGGVTDGHDKAAQISMRTMRAMVEAARGINPKDQSPQAANGRRLNVWTDLHGMEFGVIVECEISQPSNRDGRRFVNNTVYRIITPDHELYQAIMAGGEMISDKPIPEITESAQPSAAPSWASPAGQARPAAPQPPRQASMQPNTWGAPTRAAAQTPPPPPPAGGAAPAWAAPAGMDDGVPF